MRSGALFLGLDLCQGVGSLDPHLLLGECGFLRQLCLGDLPVLGHLLRLGLAIRQQEAQTKAQKVAQDGQIAQQKLAQEAQLAQKKMQIDAADSLAKLQTEKQRTAAQLLQRQNIDARRLNVDSMKAVMDAQFRNQPKEKPTK